MISTLFHITFTFFVVLDPISNVPLFASVLKHHEPKMQRRIIFREMLIALAIMIAFLFFGQALMHLLGVSLPSLQIGGGIILFMIGLKMVFSMPGVRPGHFPKDPFIVPLAVPAVAGPAILATIILYGGGLDNNRWVVLLAIFIAWVLSVPCLMLSSLLKKLLGEKGLVATERLLGFIAVLIAAQMAVNGIIAAAK